MLYFILQILIKLACILKSSENCYHQGANNWIIYLGMIHGITFPNWEFGSSRSEISLLSSGKPNIIH